MQQKQKEGKLSISLVVITLNEESHIGRCLRSASSLVDEMLVLDSGSQDRTVSLAQGEGARVVVEAWRGFGPQKNRAAMLARNNWVLSLDADEEMTFELLQEIRTLFGQLDVKTAYRFPRKSFYLGKWILYGGWYPDFQTRLFHRQYSQWGMEKIHEKVHASQYKYLKFPLHHYVFSGVEQHVATNNRYSSLQAEEFIEKGGVFRLWKLLFKPVSKFIETYFLKRGLLDGLPGLIIAVGAAYSVFIRWAKIGEKTQWGYSTYHREHSTKPLKGETEP